MITWDAFIYFALPAIACWGIGAVAALRRRPAASVCCWTAAGIAVYSAFIAGLWLSLERPPLRTMGETRMWYSLFMAVVGLAIYVRWRYRWILSFSTVMSAVFVLVNLLRPEIHDKVLMPALQSPWFAPHVIVYMFAYALLGAALLAALRQLWIRPAHPAASEMSMIDNLAREGLALLTVGMLFGALWAKEAWGHYWTWDPKETWAAATWLCYLAYLHFRLARPAEPRRALAILVAGFALLQMCWWGINYLPAARASVHAY